jgi:hypothetical protein
MSKLISSHLDFGGSARCVSLADPVDPQDAVTRAWATATLVPNPAMPEHVGGALIVDSLTWISLPIFLKADIGAGAAGAGDVQLMVASPFKMRIWDVWVKTKTAQSGSSVTLRSAAGGIGTAYTSALSTAAIGTSRDSTADYFQISLGATIYARFTNRAAAVAICMLGVNFT